MTRSTNEFIGKTDRSSISILVSKNKKNKRLLASYETDLTVEKSFVIDKNCFEGDELDDPKLHDLNLEITYNGKDEKN